MGSEDFSRVLAEVPGALRVPRRLPAATRAPRPATTRPGARFDDSVLADCATLLAELAARDLAAG